MKNKVWNYCPDDVNIIRMSIVYDEKGEAIAVKKDENGVPLYFDDLTFRNWWRDEYHPFAILWDNDEPLAIFYSPTAAARMRSILSIHFEIDASMSMVPYENPKMYGEDKYSRYLREYLFIDEFIESRSKETTKKSDPDNEFKEFKEYARKKDAELRKRIKTLNMA